MSREAVVVAALLLGATGARGQSTAYAVDAEQSRLRLELGRAGLLKMFGHDHTIEAPVADGLLEADPFDLSKSRVVLRFEARRLAIVPGTEPAQDIPEVEARMRGPEVLDVERHPRIVFTSSSVATAAGPGGAASDLTAGSAASRQRLRVRGMLEVKGRSIEVEVPLEVRSSTSGLVAAGTLELRLRDLGIVPPSVAGVVKVANGFRVTFEIHAHAAAAP